MDCSESTKVVFNRIQQLEPEHVAKIIGYLLLQEHGERHMIRLAFCPDATIRSLVDKVKSELGLNRNPQFLSHVPSDHIPIHHQFSASSTHPVSVSPPLNDLNLDDSVSKHSDFSGSFFSHDYHALPVAARTSRRSPSLPEFPVKVCHYYSKGFCKHGMNCRYFHGQIMPERDDFSHYEQHEKLEGEIIELLKSTRGSPVSVASLPTMYYEKYGKTLQAEEYAFTKLLSQLKNSVRVIDRPQGQHYVILSEDVSKFLEFSGERNEQGGVVSGSRQIYLTFPAESTFVEQDVSNYFSKFGPVQEVRIPCQQKRMFGFVTFVYAETVRGILAKGNPHFICTARVLVKPYKEKSRSFDRKYVDKPLYGMHYGSRFSERDKEMMSSLPPRAIERSKLSRRRTLEEQEHEHEHEHSTQKSLPLYLRYSSHDNLKLTPDAFMEQEERFSYFLDVLNSDPVAEEHDMNINTNFRDTDSHGLNLPENPFSYLSRTEISTVT